MLQANKFIVTSNFEKIPKNIENSIVIGTHDGRFHCDEVLATVMLKHLPFYKDAVILRSRDVDYLKGCDIVIDVGNVFDKEKQRYDHHQKGFEEYFDEAKRNIKLSSSGLIYKYFGVQLLQQFGITDEKDINWCYKHLYEDFFESIDANDNGVDICDTKPNYRITTALPNRVARLNTKWNEEPDATHEQFKKACSIVDEELKDQIESLKLHLSERCVVEEALASRHDVHPSGQLIHLKTPCSFQRFVYEYEANNTHVKPILYALYENSASQWQLRGVCDKESAFRVRKPFPPPLCGLRNSDLMAAAVNYDIFGRLLFIHSNGFLAIAESKEDALQLFSKAIVNCDT